MHENLNMVNKLLLSAAVEACGQTAVRVFDRDRLQHRRAPGGQGMGRALDVFGACRCAATVSQLALTTRYGMFNRAPRIKRVARFGEVPCEERLAATLRRGWLAALISVCCATS